MKYLTKGNSFSHKSLKAMPTQRMQLRYVHAQPPLGKYSLVPRPRLHKGYQGLAHFARNLGLADSALPEIWITNQIAAKFRFVADQVVRIALPKRIPEICD